MMRRALRVIAGSAGLTMPLMLALAAQAETAPAGEEQRVAETTREARDKPAAKAHRATERGAPAARVAPRRGDDPIAAAFSLFPGTVRESREEVAVGAEATPMVSVPMPPAPVVAVSPGVVAVERFDPSPSAPSSALIAAYAPIEPVAPAVEQALRAEPIVDAPAGKVAEAASPVAKLPMPRRKPAMTAADRTEPTLRLASLEPATDIPSPKETAAETPPIAAEVAVFGEPKKIPKEALPYLAILRREAAANKVPLWLAIGVGWVESKYNPKLRGTHGVVGIMQVMPSTARFQGYKGATEKLLDPETNIVWGLRELGWDWSKAGGNPCLAIAKYKGGIATRGIPSAAADYCRRAKAVTGML